LRDATRSSDFDYELPSELIAQHPASERGADRLLVLDRASGEVSHQAFRDIPRFFRAGDVLVLNATRVIPARLAGTRDNGRPAEILLVHPETDGTWLAMVHPGGKLKAGRRVEFGSDAVAEIVGVQTAGGGLRKIRFSGRIGVPEIMQRYGSTPLPPYITRVPDTEDHDRYQTVFARVDGSVAAPTAGLHFTTEILDRIRDAGATVVELTLHVGPGTFKPVEVDDPTQHVMHPEWFEISPGTADAVNAGRRNGHRIFATGTTVARSLEAAGTSGTVQAGSGWTSLFIYPPYRFRIVDALLTNFHLPRSTLLMLVAAFAGHDNTMRAYQAAIAERYRFYSYGDAMLVI
jgi:S-adenosylmethionine:tRNA ribosyltransferase-isomerase